MERLKTMAILALLVALAGSIAYGQTSRVARTNVRAVAQITEEGGVLFALQQQHGSNSDTYGTRRAVAHISPERVERAVSEAAEGRHVWFTGERVTFTQTVNIPRTPNPALRWSGSSSASSTVSGRGSDVKQLGLSSGQHRCTFTVSGNRDRYGGDNFIVKVGGRLQVNEIEASGSWTRLLNAGSGGSFYVEVDANSSASWSVRCS